jgi:hypothetical protein
MNKLHFFGVVRNFFLKSKLGNFTLELNPQAI